VKRVPKAARKGKLPPMSLDEFLEWDDGTDTHYELYDGRPVAMNPPIAPHARMMMTVGLALERRLRKGCATYGGGGVGVITPDDKLNYRVPDVMVSCTDSRKQWVEAPRLIVEILSPSTKRVDARDKLAFYGDMESVDEIMLVWVDKRRVDLWQREPDGWHVRSFIGSSMLPLRTTTEPLPLEELFGPMGL
jgi:Uma2 family endonuclease